jgi:hypothetical protein
MKYLYIAYLLMFFIFSCSKKEEQQQVNNTNEIKHPDSTSKQIPVDSTVVNNQQTEDKTQTSVKPVQTTYRIETGQASQYIGKKCYVKGYVADVVIREKVAYLNFEKKYPNNPFTGTVFAGDFPAFGDLEKYKNKNVEVFGTVDNYKGKPQVILNSPNQIKIINK